MQQPDPNHDASSLELAAVRASAEPIAAAHGVELLDVSWSTGPGGRILRVTIDSPGSSVPAADGTGGVTLDDCVRVSRDLSVALDVADSISCRYHLEVTSPGLDRELRRAEDFERYAGRLAKVKLTGPAADGQRVLRGRLIGAADDVLRIEVDGKVHQVPLANVEHARLVVDFGSSPSSMKPRQQRRKKKARPSAGT